MFTVLHNRCRTVLVGFSAAAASLAVCTFSYAGDFQPKRVAADAKWLAYVNVEGLLNSSIGKFMKEHGEELGFSMEGEDFEELHAQFGLNPMKDLHSATIYGEGIPEDGGSFVMLLETSAAVDDALVKMHEAVEAEAEGMPPMKVVELAGEKVNVIGEGDEVAYFQIRAGRNSSERLVVFSMNRDWMAKGIGVLEGKAAALAGAEKSSIRSSIPEGVLAFASCADAALLEVGLNNDDEPASAFLRGTKGVFAAFGETGGDTFVNLELETASKEDAQNLSDIGRGLIGMARLAGNSEPEIKPLLEPMRSLKIAVEGASISMSVRHNSAKLIEAFQAMAALAGEVDGDEDDDDETAIEIKASVGSKKVVKEEKNDDDN